MIRRTFFASLAVLLVFAYALTALYGYATLRGDGGVYAWIRTPIDPIDPDEWSHADTEPFRRESEAFVARFEESFNAIEAGAPDMIRVRKMALYGRTLSYIADFAARAFGAYLLGLDRRIVVGVLGALAAIVACAVIYGRWKRRTGTRISIAHVAMNAVGVIFAASGLCLLRALSTKLVHIELPEDWYLARMFYGCLAFGGLILVVNAAVLLARYRLAAIPIIVIYMGLSIVFAFVAISAVFVVLSVIGAVACLIGMLCFGGERERVYVIRR